MTFRNIKKVLKQRNYFLLFLISSLIYLSLSLYLTNYFFNGLSNFLTYTYYAYFNLSFNFILALLFGINLSLAYFKIKTHKSKVGFFSGFLSLFTAGCPACSLSSVCLLVAPSLAFGLVLLPFKGLEIQILGILVLSISIFIVSKDEICRK